MTAFETILLASDDQGVMRLTLNRPDRHNAFDDIMISELTEAAQQIAANPALRVVVISAQGKSFCAGADLNWMRRQFAAPPEMQRRQAAKLAAMLRAIDELPKFVIGVIAGAAFGGGVGLAAVCDVVIAGPAAIFALTETKLGLIPATIAPYVHRRIGGSALRQFALHGERFDAVKAMSIGLVSHAAAEGELEAVVEHHVRQALACAPGAIAEAKSLFRLIASGAAGEAEAVDALTRRWSAEEARAGIEALLNKERAPWQV